jgi:hypothetical protein
MNMIKVAFALCFGSLMLATTACGKSKALMAAEEYEQTACACKDAACVTDATKKFSAKAGDMATASSSEAEAITKASTNASTCVTKISMAGVPGMPAMPATKELDHGGCRGCAGRRGEAPGYPGSRLAGALRPATTFSSRLPALQLPAMCAEKRAIRKLSQSADSDPPGKPR